MNLQMNFEELYLGLYSLIGLPLVGVHGFVLIAAPYGYMI